MIYIASKIDVCYCGGRYNRSERSSRLLPCVAICIHSDNKLSISIHEKVFYIDRGNRFNEELREFLGTHYYEYLFLNYDKELETIY